MGVDLTWTNRYQVASNCLFSEFFSASAIVNEAEERDTRSQEKNNAMEKRKIDGNNKHMNCLLLCVHVL